MKWQQDTSRYIALHKKAADYFAKKGNVQAILHHAFKTNDVDF